MFDIPSTFKLGESGALLLPLSGGRAAKIPTLTDWLTDCGPVLLTRTYDISRLPSSPSLLLLFIAVILHGRADEKAIILTSVRTRPSSLSSSPSLTFSDGSEPQETVSLSSLPRTPARSSRIGLLHPFGLFGVHVEFGRDEEVGK